MRIAIDYNAALRQVAGIGRYTRELVLALARLNSDDQLILFYAASDLEGARPGIEALQEVQAANPRVTVAPIRLRERWLPILWQRARVPLPVEFWTGPIDVLHAPDFVLPPSRTRRTLVTVHDLSFRIHPEAAHARLRRYLEMAVPRSLARATHVLADSLHTAHDLQQLMSVPASKISVLYPGIGTQFQRVRDPDRLAAVRQKYNLPERFFFHVGTLEPRKNLEHLMTTFAEVRAEQRETAPQRPPLGLVLAGKPGWLSEPILKRAHETDGVVLTGPVADEDLPVLYTLSSGLVYPTLYEGFGFPPLEALACGTPVVTSNTSSIPELVNGVALMVDPRDAPGLGTALRRVLDDPSVAAVARTAGPQRSARFSWEAAAQQLLGVYYSLTGASGPQPVSRKGGRV